MKPLRFAVLTLLVVFACLLVSVAQAQGLSVNPTLVEIPAARASSAIDVRNRSDAPVAVQLSAYRWTQPDGADVLTDDSAVIVSPAIATIAPGAVQTFRIIIPAGPRPVEGSWRIILDQLPSAPATGMVAVRLRLSIPLFAAADGRVDPARPSPPMIDWQVGAGQVTATNRGLSRVRFSTLSVDGRALPLGQSPYLLAGTTRRWPMVDAFAPRITGLSDRGPIDAQPTRAPVK